MSVLLKSYYSRSSLLQPSLLQFLTHALFAFQVTCRGLFLFMGTVLFTVVWLIIREQLKTVYDASHILSTLNSL